MDARHPITRIPAENITVTDAANLFLEELYQRAHAHQVGWEHYRHCKIRLKRILTCFPREMLLSDVGKRDLAGVVLYFASRPPSGQRPYQTRPLGEPIALATAKDYILQLKGLFAWIAEQEELDWDRPKGFGRLFRIKDRRMRTPAEEELEARTVVTGEVATFAPSDLTRLFRAGRSLDRLYILLGLNCGFTSGEISALRTFEVYLDEAEPFIHKRRAKTGIEAKWVLWPETASLLRRHRAPANIDRRWLLTLEGNPLVMVDERHRRDSIDRAWKALVARVGMRWMGFRFLRKTGASAIKRLSGIEESEMYLAHQEPGLNKHYANRNWDRMWSSLRRFREQVPFLGAAWDLDPSECLFTQDGSPEWSEVNPPWVQRVTKRSESGLLNVSLHKGKRKYHARVYRRGRTHCSKYFVSPEDAAKAAQLIRQHLERSTEGACLRTRPPAKGSALR